jgi:intracellular sulfur oxidation DsrE/DsrF family protein|nr:DsrE family protein [uncultured Emticicia sp.]
MKKLFILSLLCLSGSLTFAQKKIYPLIKSGGGMFEVPEATPVVDKKMQYKIIVDLSKASDKPDSVNSALDKLARLLNAHIEAGVPKENLSVIGVIHFLGTPIILEDEAYKKKFGMANPNTALINELGKNGVRFYVCGQSLRARKLVDEKRNEHIKVAQSALITFSTFQNMGYALLLP